MATNMEVPHIEDQAYVPKPPQAPSPPTYSEAFPELPVPTPRPDLGADLPVNEPKAWPANNKFHMRSSTCTQVCRCRTTCILCNNDIQK